MQLFRALYAFWATLCVHECDHARLASAPGKTATASYCPDCGYRVAVHWTIVRCRTCGSKRHPKKSLDGRIAPLYRYCQHCGEADYQIVKRDRINVHEMPYAILTKDVDYTEAPLGMPRRAPNPFETWRSNGSIVEGQILRKEETLGGSRV